MAQVNSLLDAVLCPAFASSSACSRSSSQEMALDAVEPQFPFEFPYEWDQPVASVQEEEDAEEDGYMACLAERIAHAMLEDEDTADLEGNTTCWAAENTTPLPSNAAQNLYFLFFGSEIWSGSEAWSSSSSSLTGSSQNSPLVSSPPSTPFPLRQENDPCDMLYPAAVEVKPEISDGRDVCETSLTQHQGSKVQTHRNLAFWGDHGLLGPSSKLLTPALGHESHAKVNGFPSLSSYKDQITSSKIILQHRSSFGTKGAEANISGAKITMPKQASVSMWESQNNALMQQTHGCNKAYGGRSGQNSLPRRWTPLPAAGSGLTAVFLGAHASAHASGTGVFFPRHSGIASYQKRKPVCSTVLLPAHIIQTMNLNAEGVSSPLLRSVPADKNSTAI